MAKMTKKNYFEILRASYPTTADNYDDVVAFIDHEIELLNKKNSAERKPTAKEQKTNDLREMLVEILRSHAEPMCISDIKEADPMFADMNPQQVSGIIRPLLLNGVVKREEIKRKAYFSIA